jgi:hypothetical protein
VHSQSKKGEQIMQLNIYAFTKNELLLSKQHPQQYKNENPSEIKQTNKTTNIRK